MSGRHDQHERRELRRRRIRRRVTGEAIRPRLSVFRSARHIYAQIVDDRSGLTLASASSRETGLAPEGQGKVGLSIAVGKRLAAKAKEHGVAKVAFDRGGYLYHGRVKALAEGARAGGLDF